MNHPSPLPEPGCDQAVRIRQVRRAHERYLESGQVSPAVRDVVAASWRRCRDAGVDPELDEAPVQLADDDLRAYREGHPLAALLPMFRALLGGVAAEENQLVAVTDAHGRLLWVEGHPTVRRRAARMNFTEGAVWNERRVGTNAPGTALAVNDAVQVVAAEHFSRVVQPWTCSAAPVRDPFTGEVLGAIDLTGGDHLGTPSALALVRATALAAEGELARVAAARAAAPLWVPGLDAGAVRLEVLGRDEGILSVGASRQRLTRRHSEILTILAEHPKGLTGEQLGLELYGDDINPVTLRAELVRLRRLVGPNVLGSRPYRLAVTSDLTDVLRLLDAGSVAAALAEYRGPLLPLSEAPGIHQSRWLVEQRLRSAVVASRDPGLLSQWANTSWGRDDLQIWELLAGLAPGALRSLAGAQIRRLAAEYGVPRHMQPRRNVAAPTFPVPVPRGGRRPIESTHSGVGPTPPSRKGCHAGR